MKQRTSQNQAPIVAVEPVDTRLSLRLDEPIAERFSKVVVASKRSKTSIIEECLEELLPKLEKQYKVAA